MKKRSYARYSSAANSVSGVPAAFSRARALLRQQLGSAALSRFRQLTHQPTRGFLSLKGKARVSSRSGALSLDTPLKNLKISRNTHSLGVERLRQPTPLEITKICKERKERREVIFAKGKEGGNHKPPTYTFKSLVRCN